MTNLTYDDVDTIHALLDTKNHHFPISERVEYQQLKTFSTKDGFYDLLLSLPVSNSLSLKLVMEEEIARHQKVDEKWVQYFVHQNKKNIKSALDELMPILPFVKEWGFMYSLSSYIDQGGLASSDLKDFYENFKYRMWPVMTGGRFSLSSMQELVSPSEKKFIQHAQHYEFSECLKMMREDPAFLPKNTGAFLWSTLFEEDFNDIKALTKILSLARKEFDLPLEDVLPSSDALAPLVCSSKKFRKSLLAIMDTLGNGEKPDVAYLQNVFALNSQYLLTHPKEFSCTCQMFSRYIPSDFPFVFKVDFDDDTCEQFEPIFWKKTVGKALHTLHNQGLLSGLPEDIVGFYGLCAEMNDLSFDRTLIKSLPAFGEDYMRVQQHIRDYFDGLEPKEEDLDHFFSTYDAYVLKSNLHRSLGSCPTHADASSYKPSPKKM